MNWLVTGFLLVIIAVVFQQIATSMTEQGIASGSPYDNAAAYPKAVAIIIGVLLALQLVISRFDYSTEPDEGTPLASLVKPALLLVIFSFYLGLLGKLGYHLMTPPMIMGVMLLCGVRNVITLVVAGAGISFVFAFLFEYFLKIVLPGGIFALNIPW